MTKRRVAELKSEWEWLYDELWAAWTKGDKKDCEQILKAMMELVEDNG